LGGERGAEGSSRPLGTGSGTPSVPLPSLREVRKKLGRVRMRRLPARRKAPAERKETLKSPVRSRSQPEREH